jgi:NAD(P)-dependent dehydrogenase (short-subunit alcohol dehydrogenase family)
MADAEKLAVVTGGNRGLGLETCRRLAQLGYTVILAARNPSAGEQAANALSADGLNVVYHHLDVTDLDTVHKLRNHIRATYDRLDVLVNNAGVFLDSTLASIMDASLKVMRTTLETNTLGAMTVAQCLIPLMYGNGRVVNVSSCMGQLDTMEGHWPAYRISKTALNALTRILADELSDTNVKVNSVCPGWVRTDMGGPNAERSVEEGADTIVWAATLPDDGPSGKFFRDREEIPW